MRELSLHILDLSENSISAGATKIEIKIEENLNKDILLISIKDNGKGMDAEMVKIIADPFITSRTERKVGLGIPLLKAAAEACNGWLRINSEVGIGTSVTVQFQHSHIDRVPLGNIVDTFITLELGTNNVNWVFIYKMNDQEVVIDDNEIKQTLDGVSLTEPSVIKFIRQLFEESINEVRSINQLATPGGA
ncbi:MAG: ATP-binding protein [Anaerolineaceae bacterium]|nr:ATP-binding protein [Anaerolineaceae bacterium]